MSTVDDLVTWLRAQLDDDERVARAAADYSAERGYSFPTDDSGTYNMLAWEHEQHATRHDPARVLRQVERDRRLLDYLVALEGKALDGNWWNLDTDEPFKLLALPYADRPGYRPEWKPDA